MERYQWSRLKLDAAYLERKLDKSHLLSWLEADCPLPATNATSVSFWFKHFRHRFALRRRLRPSHSILS